MKGFFDKIKSSSPRDTVELLYRKLGEWSFAPAVISTISFSYLGAPSQYQQDIRSKVPALIKDFLLDMQSVNDWHSYIFYSAIALAAVAAHSGNRSTSRYKTLYSEAKEQVQTLTEEKENKSIDTYEILSQLVRDNYFFKFNLSHSERVSLYLLDLNNFACIARYSEKESYNNKPARHYPKNEGCISKAWDTGAFEGVIPHCPIRSEEKWIEHCSEEFNLDRDTAKGMTMKSRAFLSLRIRDRNLKNLAVLVFESENEDGLKFTKIRTHFKQNNEREAKTLCDLITGIENHIPKLETARREGF